MKTGLISVKHLNYGLLCASYKYGHKNISLDNDVVEVYEAKKCMQETLLVVFFS